MKMSLIHTNALLVATTDLDNARRRANGALTQVALLHEDAKNPQDLQARTAALTADLRSILARIASAESRVRICLHEADTPAAEPAQTTPPVEPARPEVAPSQAPVQVVQSPPPGGPPEAPLYEDFEGVRIRVGVTKPRAGYIHWRSRRHVIADALDIGIPAEVVHHANLMTENLKPTALGWKHTEKLIAQVREAESKKVAPDKLWQKWLTK